MAIHYRFTDTKGRTHTRTSRRHVKPQFTHGVISHHGPAVSGSKTASFCGSRELAEREASARQKYGHTTEICTVFVSDRPFPKAEG